MSNTNSTTNVSFLSLAAKSIKVPMQTSVTLASATLSLAEEFSNNIDVVVDRVKGIGRSLDAGIIAIEAASFAAVNSGLEQGKKLTIQDWEDPNKRKEAIFSIFNGEEVVQQSKVIVTK